MQAKSGFITLVQKPLSQAVRSVGSHGLPRFVAAVARPLAEGGIVYDGGRILPEPLGSVAV